MAVPVPTFLGVIERNKKMSKLTSLAVLTAQLDAENLKYQKLQDKTAMQAALVISYEIMVKKESVNA